MHAAAVQYDLHIPVSRSLKAKRAAIKPIIDGIRHRYHVSVAEVGYQDQWQRSAIGIAVVSGDAGHLDDVLETIERFVRSVPDVEVLAVETSYLEVEG
jgi:uncharacterized protein YlxP (DUF503 family)